MVYAFWLSLIVFLLVAGLLLEVALGMRRIGRLGTTPPLASDAMPSVSVIVPALNEADTIEPALRSLLALDYPALEVVAIDDRSTDATPDILDRIAAAHPALRVLHLRDLPPGWLGKNHALHRGAQLAGGDYLLFTDADVVFAPDSLRRAIAYCEREHIDHLALLFDLIARSALLRMLMLSFNVGFMARFKPWKVGTSPTHFIGIGAFNLVRRQAYLAAGGHAAIPLEVLDDMMLGKRIKRHGCRQQVLFGRGLVSIEWYRGTREMMRGLEKNIFAAFDYQIVQLLVVTLLVLVLRVWPWLALFITSGAARALNLATIVAGFLLYADVLRISGWGYRCLLFAPVVSLLELAIWWRGSLLTLLRGGITWRGTHYGLPELKRAHRQAD